MFLRLCFDLTLMTNGLELRHYAWLKSRLSWSGSLCKAQLTEVYAQIERESVYAQHPINPRLALEFIAQKWQTFHKA